ncbi:MAG: hypothetical protein RR248_00545 [Clostridia bacterium]
MKKHTVAEPNINGEANTPNLTKRQKREAKKIEAKRTQKPNLVSQIICFVLMVFLSVGLLVSLASSPTNITIQMIFALLTVVSSIGAVIAILPALVSLFSGISAIRSKILSVKITAIIFLVLLLAYIVCLAIFLL